MEASPEMQEYFDSLNEEVKVAHALATKARAKLYDPSPEVEVKLAKNMAERVEGLISVVAPQIVDSGVADRIIELEAEYGTLNWRVAFKIAEEIAMQKFCKFKDELEAIDVGIRAGFAYVTVGVVSSPLDGVVTTEFKDRMDKRGKYISISYAGPIRNAGGTSAAVSALIADYVRKKMGYDVYDATDSEIKRAVTELADYHDRVTNLQYYPSADEITFLMKNMPVEIAGEPSERFEVSNYKDLPRVATNTIRSGFCLMLSSCIPLKAPKLWKQLSVWGKEMGMEHWGFLEEFLKIQKKSKAKAGGKKQASGKVMPDYTYLADLVAGRPILGNPLRPGAFRLRYGRSRASGLMGQGMHPATMQVLDDYIAIGTQLKVERPNKSAAFTPCDLIDGPIVKLKDGSVLRLNSESLAIQVKKDVEEILFLGDSLVDYGDFADRNQMLVPPGYCQEWWAKEIEKFLTDNQIKSVPSEKVQEWIKSPLTTRPTVQEAIALSSETKIPLHPFYTYHWKDIDRAQLIPLIDWLGKAKLHNNEGIRKLVFPLNHPGKRTLEILGVPHIVVNKEFAVIEHPHALAFTTSLGITDTIDLDVLKHALGDSPDLNSLQVVQKLSLVPLQDKSGTYVGSRMGRPEKAKQRKLTGSPHCLFPIGEEGGKMRSIQAAIKVGKVSSQFPLRHCSDCNSRTPFVICEQCGKQTIQDYFCRPCQRQLDKPECDMHGKAQTFQYQAIDIKRIFYSSLKLLQMDTFPDMIKGVRGTSNASHNAEHPSKGILRAKHDLCVNKDGTIRYDCSEVTLTHFKPSEIGTSVEKLRELGYAKDISGMPLERDDQILEIKPQDVVLPSCDVGPKGDEASDEILIRTTKFLDELLIKVYKQEPFYNISSTQELVGHLIIGLAPHTSAGMLGRIIGFVKSQGFLAHPYYHQACRRDCDGDEIGFLLLMDGFLNFSKNFLPGTRGATMDAPLVLTSTLIPTEVDDQAFNVGIGWSYPLELYTAATQCKMPYEVKIKQIKNVLSTPAQFEGMGFTHDTTNINAGVLCSAYKTLPSMEEKLKGQMRLAEKIRAVDTKDVARLVIEKHFIRDTKGNLRKFSMQEFRCVNCNEKYRRPPLIGKCLKCKGRILFTITEGSVVKYFGPTVSLCEKYDLSPYLRQTVEILQRRIEGVFGKDKEKQLGLGTWFG